MSDTYEQNRPQSADRTDPIPAARAENLANPLRADEVEAFFSAHAEKHRVLDCCTELRSGIALLLDPPDSPEHASFGALPVEGRVDV